MKKLILAIAIFLGASPLWAELMTYQGRLKESGIPVTGNRLLTFEFCDQEDGSGVCLMAPGTPASFAVANGLFKSTITIHPNVDLAAGAWYLRVTVGSSVLAPLERLTAVPYSVFASSAGYAAYAAGAVLQAGDTMTGPLTLAGSTLTVTGNAFSVGGSTFVVKDGSVGIGTASPNNPLEVWTNGQYVFTGGAPTSDAVVNLIPQVGGTAMINNNADGSVALAVGHVSHLLVDKTGNVGVGSAVPSYRLSVSSGAGETGTIMAVSTGTSNLFWVTGDGAHALRFVGDGSGLTGVTGATGTDPNALQRAGGTMLGPIDMNGNFLAGVSTITLNSSGSLAIVPAGTGGSNVSYGISIGSNTYNNYTNGLGIGHSARDNYLGGVGLGNTAFQNYSYGVGIGNGAANNYSFGVGIGNGASGNNNSGVGIGVQALGNSDFAVGIGAYSKNNRTFGAALGAYSYAASSATALGSYARANAERSIAIGNQTVNDSTGTASFGSYGVNAAFYQINGSTVLAILPGIGSMGIGVNAGASETQSYNIYIGSGSGRNHTTGTNNTMLGYLSGQSNLSGSGNTFLGSFAGLNNVSGGHNLVIGYSQDTSAGNSSYEMNIGGLIFGKMNDKTVGISTRAPQAALDIVSTGTAHTEMAQIWRDSTGLIVGSMSVTGSLQAVRFVGDGSGLAGVTAAGAVQKAGDTMTGPLHILSDDLLNDTSDFITTGLVISTGGAIRTTGIGHGTVAGNARGRGAVDLQTTRQSGTHAATGDHSVISGGHSNLASSQYSAVGGGYNNTATLNGAVVAGGSGNDARGTASSITGGVNNLASGSWSAVAGGNDNRATGSYSAVPGGYNNTAEGNYSFAAGAKSSSTAQGAFTWQDSGGTTLNLINNVTDRTVFKSRGGFMVTGSTNASGLGGLVDRGVIITGNGLVGISTYVPQAALDIVSAGNTVSDYAQIWRDSDGVARASVTATGVFYGDGSGLANVTASGAVQKIGDVMTGPLTINSPTLAQTNDFVTTGIMISTGGAIRTTGLGHGTAPGNSRGMGAVDLQTYRAVNTEVASGYMATLSGGYSNTASGYIATVSGGQGNAASGAWYPTVSGGYYNTASGNYAAVSGGQSNTASYSFATVSGGYYNTASNTRATVSGGESNTANGSRATVSGGVGNTASGSFATVSGGSTNTALGQFSWAGGNRSSSTADGAFTWSDSKGYEIRNTAADRTLFKNEGGFMVAGSTVAGSAILPVNQGMLDIISTGTTVNQYAQVWRDSDGVAKASVTATGVFYGSGAGLTGVAASDPTKLPLAGGTLTGNFRVSAATMTLTATGSSAQLITAGLAGGATMVMYADLSSAGLFTNSSARIGIGPNMGEKLTVATSGVGVNRTAPGAALDVSGATRLLVDPATGYILTAGLLAQSPMFFISTAGIVGVGDFATRPASTDTVLNVSHVLMPGKEMAVGLTVLTRSDPASPISVAGEETGVLAGNFEAEAGGDDSMEHLAALRAQVRREGGAGGMVQHAAGLWVDHLYSDGGGTIVNTYGIRISTLTTSGQTNSPYAIYSEDRNARTYLAGYLGISSATPVAALVVSSAAGSSDKMLIVSTGTTEVFSVKGSGEVYTVGKFIGDGSLLTNLSGDGLGNHIATTTLQMGGYAINSSTAVNAAYYQINGSTVLALKPSRGLNIGPLAGRISSGANNVFVGDSAGHDTTTGPRSTFLGNDSGRLNTTGTQNSYLGYGSGFSNTTGNDNTVVGAYAAYYNQTGSANAILGLEAGMSAVSNSFSSATLVGYQAGKALTTGSDNILMGFRAGDNLQAGSRNIIIGYNLDATAPTISDEIRIGSIIYGNMATGGVALGAANTLPAAALDVKSTATASNVYAQIWRNSGGTIVSSVSATGVMMAAKFVGDGSGLSNISALDPSKVSRSGDTMTGPLTIAGSSLTIRPAASDAYSLYVSSADGSAPALTVRPGGELYTAGRVGIGSAAPTEALDISGRLLLSTRAISNADTDGLISFGSNGMAFQSGGNTYMRVANGGNYIGIGPSANVQTTTNSPRLQVKGSMSVGSGYGTSQPPVNSLVVEGRLGAGTSTPDAALSVVQSDVAGSSYTVHIGTSASAYHLVVTTGGWVGLNTHTPQAPLHLTAATKDEGIVVEHNSDTSEGSYLALLKARGTSNSQALVQNGDNLGVLAFGGYNGAAGDPFPTAAAIVGRVDGTPSVSPAQDMPGRLEFMTAADNTTNMVTRMVITNNGGVGISTGNPQAMLDIRSTSTIAQIWRDSGGVARATMTASGVLYAEVGSAVQKIGDNMTGNLSINVDTTLYAADFNTTGIRVSTAGSITTIGLGNGISTPNQRGRGAVDLQTARAITGQVAFGDFSTLSGGAYNTIHGSNTVIAGGLYNIAAGTSAVISGGEGNYAASMFSTIGGGKSNAANGNHSAVFSGEGNLADEMFSLVGGGYSNTANTAYTVVAGGYGNEAGVSGGDGYGSFIGGGQGNRVNQNYGAIAGGMNNSVGDFADYAFIGGGYENDANGTHSAVAGGWWNVANGMDSFIGGGLGNVAAGSYSSVVGGSSNTARGDYSFAAGYKSSSTAAGTFTWADSQGVEVLNDVQDQVRFKASGGFLVSGSTNTADPGFFVSGDGSVTMGNGLFISNRGVIQTTGLGTNNVGPGARDATAVDLQHHRENTTQVAGAYLSVISGGGSNRAGNRATVAGGQYNVASGQGSAVAGGYTNTAAGAYSAVPGGLNNSASSDYSFAAGRRAQSAAVGAFTWADSRDVPLFNNVQDRVWFKASGGFLVSGSTNTVDPGLFVSGDGRVAIGATSIPANPARLQVSGDLGLGDGSQTGNTPVVIWLTASTAFADGDVVIASGNNQFGTTTTANSSSVIGVAQGSGALSAVGKIAVAGVVVANCVGGTVGQHAVTSATAGSVSGTGFPSSGTGVGLFLTDCGNPNVNQARLLLK